ncbi:MAG: hypothetical protein CMM54_02220 [Rhodospirillaceae bacterium]|nr:hypothetical protein [Rhodospirillaceae bacterium]|tara:strand:+ start:5639 stop:5824 length:186 start_codon:yes stop_codon:yes gene_type:complete
MTIFLAENLYEQTISKTVEFAESASFNHSIPPLSGLTGDAILTRGKVSSNLLHLIAGWLAE